MTITDEQIEKAEAAFLRVRDGGGCVHAAFVAALEAVMPGEPGELERLRAENERLRAIALGVIALEDEPDAYPSCDTERLIEQARDVLDGRRHPAAERLRALWIRNAERREALEWYAGKVRDCRKIGPEGDAARAALDADAGKRARVALAEGGRDE